MSLNPSPANRGTSRGGNEASSEDIEQLGPVRRHVRMQNAECRMQNAEPGGRAGTTDSPASDIELMSKIVVRRIGSILRK